MQMLYYGEEGLGLAISGGRIWVGTYILRSVSEILCTQILLFLSFLLLWNMVVYVHNQMSYMAFPWI